MYTIKVFFYFLPPRYLIIKQKLPDDFLIYSCINIDYSNITCIQNIQFFVYYFGYNRFDKRMMLSF